MNHKEEFKAFCEKEKNLPLFLTYGWLNTVAPDNWNVVIEKRGDEIAGIFPYILNKRKGLKFIELVPLTPYGGPWVCYPEEQKYTNRLSYEKEIFSNLIQKLPAFDSFLLKFHPSVTNWLPFYWKGYSQETWYTYILPKLNKPEEVFENFKIQTRTEIRKAEKTIRIKTSNNIEILYYLKVQACRAGKGTTNAKPEYLSKIFNFCKEENCGEVLVAYEEEKIHSAALFVWDKNTVYYLYSASDPNHKNSGASSLLIWEAIKRYSEKTNVFNFEGSMIEGIESFFRSFGAKQVPYFVIKKQNSRLLQIKNFLNILT